MSSEYVDANEDIDVDSDFESFIMEVYVDMWRQRLRHIVRRCLSAERRPVLVALSRKMPRFVNWFRENYLDSFDEDRKLLDSLELTTELAVPFICLNESAHEVDNIDFIIVDDVIARGKTLARVADLLYKLTDRKPFVVCMAMASSVRQYPKVERMGLDRTPRGGMEQICDITGFVSTKVEEAQLPVDMEFPIFTLKSPAGMTAEEKRAAGAEAFSRLAGEIAALYDDRSFTRTGDGSRISVELKAPKSGDMVDFSKIRYFLRGDGEIVMELFSPHILAEYSLIDRIVSPFDDCDGSEENLLRFKTVWNRTTARIKNSIGLLRVEGMDAIAQELVKTLAVWCNYLLSLSTFARHFKSLVPILEMRERMELSRESLSLIVGKSLAYAIYDDLVEMVANGICVECSRERAAGIPTCFANTLIAKLVTHNKLSSLFNTHTIEEGAEAIFRFMHFHNPMWKTVAMAGNSASAREVGESYDSLIEAMAPMYGGHFEPWRLKQWVDAQIDAGRIIPKYERVQTMDGIAYWRRFFFAGLRPFTTQQEVTEY